MSRWPNMRKIQLNKSPDSNNDKHHRMLLSLDDVERKNNSNNYLLNFKQLKLQGGGGCFPTALTKITITLPPEIAPGLHCKLASITVGVG